MFGCTNKVEISYASQFTLRTKEMVKLSPEIFKSKHSFNRNGVDEKEICWSWDLVYPNVSLESSKQMSTSEMT